MNTVKSNGIIREVKSRKKDIQEQRRIHKQFIYGMNRNWHELEIPLKVVCLPYDGDENFMHLLKEDKELIFEIIESVENEASESRIFNPRLLTEENTY